VDDLTPTYKLLCSQAQALLSGQAHRMANAANLSALIFQELPDLNWAGFYFVEGNELIVGPFQGKPACVSIPMGKGVCGTAASLGKTQRVDDVHAFDGHIACDAASRSEIVVPLYLGDVLIGVLDIDSPLPGRFGHDDQIGIEALAKIYIDSLG
jgi:GAF domain-containing protein